MRDVYDRFAFRHDKAAQGEGINLRGTVSLVYPLPDSKRCIAGMLGESRSDLRLYDGNEWKSIAWSSVAKITVVRSKEQATPASSVTPRFIYRTGDSTYSNVWVEYSIPEQDEKQQGTQKGENAP